MEIRFIGIYCWFCVYVVNNKILRVSLVNIIDKQLFPAKSISRKRPVWGNEETYQVPYYEQFLVLVNASTSPKNDLAAM